MARINVDSRILTNLRKDDIIVSLNEIIDRELAKDLDKMNTQLVDACVDALVEIEKEQDDKFNAFIPLMSSEKFLKRITNEKKGFKSLNVFARAAIVAAVVASGTFTANAAVEQITGVNMLQSLGDAVHDQLEDWGIIKTNGGITQFEGEDDDGDEPTTETTTAPTTTTEPTTVTTTQPVKPAETTTKRGIVQFEGEDEDDETTQPTQPQETTTETTKPAPQEPETTTKKPPVPTTAEPVTIPDDEPAPEIYLVGVKAEYDNFKTDYVYGEELTYDGLTLTKVFSDGTEEKLPLELCYYTTGVDMNKTADYTLTILYQTCKIEIPITVRPDDDSRGSKICSNGTFDYLLTDKGAYVTAYYGTDDSLVLNEIDSHPVFAIGANTFERKGIEYFSSDTVEKIFPSAFKNSEFLTDCYTPKAVSIGKSAFEGCTDLKDVVYSDNLTELGASAFKNTSITKLVVPEGVTSIGDALCKECKNLTEVIFEGKVEMIGEEAFSDCENLETVKGTSNIKDVKMYAFYNDTKVNFDEFPKELHSAGTQAFAYCNSLKIDEIGSSLTELGEAAFLGCHNISKVVISSEIKSVPTEAFRGAHITELILEEGVEEICQGAFMSISVRKVVLPSTMKRIGNYGLYTVFLREVQFNKDIEEIDDGAFMQSSRLMFYVYKSSAAHTYAIDNDIKYALYESDVHEPYPGITQFPGEDD